MTSTRRPLDETETRIGLAGDWEGDARWGRRALALLAEQQISTVLHLGDLTLASSPRARQFLSELEGVCRRFGITLYLTPGNHDDHSLIKTLPVDPDRLSWASDHLAILPRGHRWAMAGKTFLSLGGAPSIDFPSRTRGRDWWPEEMIGDDDVARVAADGHTDVMLTHDAPAPATPAVNRIIQRGNRSGWSKRGRRYAAQGRERVTAAFNAAHPHLLAHGHFHVPDQAVIAPDGWGHRCQVLSLASGGKYGNLAVLDLTDEAAARITHRWL